MVVDPKALRLVAVKNGGWPQASRLVAMKPWHAAAQCEPSREVLTFGQRASARHPKREKGPGSIMKRKNGLTYASKASPALGFTLGKTKEL
jgi:hypothetical protein